MPTRTSRSRGDVVAAKERGADVPLVLFDGVCGLCDRAVQFLLRHDRHQALLFAPLQGETARSVLVPGPSGNDVLSAMIFVRGYGTRHPATFARSDAWIEILRELGGAWGIGAWLRFIPRPIRDLVYDWIARNRYAWFGKFDQCRIPSPEERARFLP
ncbi:MAG: thiol-disulfide oxidoreductase DCC family protein [Gemmatimonadaceae bacterium]